VTRSTRGKDCGVDADELTPNVSEEQRRPSKHLPTTAVAGLIQHPRMIQACGSRLARRASVSSRRNNLRLGRPRHAPRSEADIADHQAGDAMAVTER
jgi:hypothetical protein